MNNFAELARIRQSDRKYSDQPIEKEKLQLILETTRISPSANNSQPWKFIVVDDPELKNKIAECAASLGMNGFAKEAPVMVAIVLEKMNILSKLGSVIKDKEYSLLDIGIATNQLCLQAADLGLGTCIIGWFNEKEVKKLLHIPSGRRVPLLISVGYPAGATREKVRKATEEMSGWNSYQG